MASKSYEHLILIGEDSNFNLNSLNEQINGINWGANQVEINAADDSISLTINCWNFEIGLNDSEHILYESQEIANNNAKNHKLFESIKCCKRRLELGGDPDFDMEYFNDFCSVLEKIESFSSIYTWNPRGGFLNL
ncbi:MAG: hypothetical protein JKY54_00090 [Flavobacteriales bacterium]|nr:hypothetical protein [Flavobacteriales bacterium]